MDKLHAAGLVGNGSDRRHTVARYAAVLSRFPATPDTRDLLNQLRRIFNKTVLEQVNLLDELVPQYPASGALATRNHEYPFQRTAADWRAPSDEDSFTSGEMRRIRNCAGMLVRRLRQILDALDLIYP